MYTLDNTQMTIFTRSWALPTLIHVGYHAITDHIQFDMTECATMQLHIAFECLTAQLCITLECATTQS